MKLESQMTCEEVRADLPLFVGGDLFDDDQGRLLRLGNKASAKRCHGGNHNNRQQRNNGDKPPPGGQKLQDESHSHKIAPLFLHFTTPQRPYEPGG